MNRITISEETPEHLIGYLLGLLDGMGFRYHIDQKSKANRAFHGNRHDGLYRLDDARNRTDKPNFNKHGYRDILNEGDSDAIKVVLR